jgi:hypothetical protein
VTDNVLRFTSSETSDPARDGPELDHAEVRGRRAFGLVSGTSGGIARHNAPQFGRSRLEERSGGDRQRRRFVQDGEVPVVLVGGSALASGSTHATNRLADAEVALEAERKARLSAEKMLAAAQALVHDLQTKIGHANLAHDEAVETARGLQAQKDALEAVLVAERETRATAQLILDLTLSDPTQTGIRHRTEQRHAAMPALAETPVKRRGRPPGSRNKAKATAGKEPLPVRWW